MAIEKTIDINVNSKQAQKGLNDLEKSIDGVNKEVQQTNASTQAMGNTVDKATGGAVSKFKALKGTLSTVIASFKSLRIAIIGTGIGALVIAITSLGQAFTRSEEGQNKFAKILGVIGSVTGNLLDLLADLGEGIISVFENPKQALIDFKNLLVENITNRFKAVLDTVGFLGSAIKNVFSGEFKAALDDAKKAGSSFVDSFTGVENSINKATNAVKEFGKEIAADASAAAKIADQRAKAEKLARDLIVERAEAERKIAELREKAVNKDKFTAQERIEFLEEAGRISDELAAKEVEVAQIRLEAKRTENALTKSNKDDLDEQARLEAEVIQKETQRLNLQKRLSTELLTSRREEAAAQKAIVDAENKRNEEAAAKEQARIDAIDKIRNDAKLKRQDAEAQDELAKINLQEQRQLAELDRLKASEEQKQEVIAYYDSLRTQNEANLIKARIELDKKERDAKLSNASEVSGAINGLTAVAGESTVAGKALGIASATIDTYVGANKAIAKGGFVGIAQAVAIIATGLKNVASIASTKVPSVAGVSTSVGGGGAAQPQAPSFNIVGATQTSQLAEAIGEQTQQPVQAYVVANDVTTAQSLNNNIVEGATL